MQTERLTVELLQKVELEAIRFINKVKECKSRLVEVEWSSSGLKETGAVKRAALDLKNELTRITQSKR